MDQGISGDAKKLELIHNECGQLQGSNIQVVFFRKVSGGGDLQKQQAVYDGDASEGVGGADSPRPHRPRFHNIPADGRSKNRLRFLQGFT